MIIRSYKAFSFYFHVKFNQFSWNTCRDHSTFAQISGRLFAQPVVEYSKCGSFLYLFNLSYIFYFLIDTQINGHMVALVILEQYFPVYCSF